MESFTEDPASLYEPPAPRWVPLDDFREPLPAVEKPKLSSCLLEVSALGALALVLLVLLFPEYKRNRDQVILTTCNYNLGEISTALEMYSTDWGGKYPPTFEALKPNYLTAIPQCPSAATVTYEAAIGKKAPLNREGKEDYFYIACAGTNHTAVSITGDYPAYSSVQGLIERSP